MAGSSIGGLPGDGFGLNLAEFVGVLGVPGGVSGAID